MFYFWLGPTDLGAAEDELDGECSQCGAKLTDAEEGFTECGDCRD